MHSHYKDSDANTLIEQESRHNQCHSLTQAVEALRTPQRIYMPGVFHLLDDINPDSVTNAPECTKLWLPSSLPAASRDGWCLFDLPLIEFCHRYDFLVRQFGTDLIFLNFFLFILHWD